TAHLRRQALHRPRETKGECAWRAELEGRTEGVADNRTDQGADHALASVRHGQRVGRGQAAPSAIDGSPIGNGVSPPYTVAIIGPMSSATLLTASRAWRNDLRLTLLA